MSTQEELFNENDKMISFVIKKMNLQKRKDLDFDDLISYGYEGLQYASKNYDESKGKFSTFAYICIRNRLLFYIREQFRKNKLKTVSIDQEIRKEDEDFDCLLTDVVCEYNNEIENNIEKKELIDEILASLVASRREKDQEIFIMYILGYRQEDIAKKARICQSAISRSISETTKSIKSILSLIDKGEKFPNRNLFKTSKDYRSAFSEYYSKRFNKRRYLESSCIIEFERYIAE